MNSQKSVPKNIILSAVVTVVVFALLWGMQQIPYTPLQVVFAALAGIIVLGAVVVTQESSFRLTEGLRGAGMMVFPLPWELLIFIGVPLLAGSILMDSPASLLSGALLGGLVITLILSWTKVWRPNWTFMHMRRDDWMQRNPRSRDSFGRFSDRSRHVLTLAQEEAQRLNHGYIGTEHILLGLIRETDSVAVRILYKLGVDLDQVKSALRSHIESGGKSANDDGIALTPRAKNVIELAVDEARRLNHNNIGTAHLLIGLAREREGIAAGVLAGLGVDIDKARAEFSLYLAETSRGAEEEGG